MKTNKTIKLGLIWYVSSLIIYWIPLYVFRKYEILSTFYHFLLLFPLALVFTKKEKWGSIGFRRGNVKEGMYWLLLWIVLMVGKLLISIYFLNRSLKVELSYSLFSSFIIAPTTEEMFFRGFLQEKFTVKLTMKYARYVSIVLASLLFVGIHLPKFSIGMYNLLDLGGIFVLGVIFGLAYNEGDSVLWPISLHAIWNLTVSLLT